VCVWGGAQAGRRRGWGGRGVPLIWESRRACARAPPSVGAAAAADTDHNMQRVTSKMQRATCNMQRESCDAAVAQYAAIIATGNYNMRRMSRATCNTPAKHATTAYMQHATRYMYRATRRMQHATACNMQRAGAIFFETNDLVSTRDWKAMSSALDRNQPTTKFGQGLMNRGENPLIDRSSGIGP
jgi:hypothetical protein